ncbi:camphor resistance protein CrcB [Limimaricola cinnabarinus]|uniref:Camphor resistance protein CrcB n=2 Tax=Limimaricola cinnabarinus TaxID=1125964 RepID=A0A2G1MJP9_9RHOB|nr:camphor resistance protein CrcB [Limimaricola cinnabarinus]
MADIETMQATGTVAEAMDRLEAAVTEAGATVFARVDHGGGAEQAGMTLADSELLIFGNPQLGTPVMQEDPLAGLYLPLKILAYDDGSGQVHIAYEEVEETFDDLDVDDDLDAIEKMENALEKFARAAAGE